MHRKILNLEFLWKIHCKAIYTPPYLNLLANSASASFYNILNKQYNNITLKTKWATILSIDLDEKDWVNIYRVCFRSIKRNDLIWFQFRVIQLILGTRDWVNWVILLSGLPKGSWILVKSKSMDTKRLHLIHWFNPSNNYFWTLRICGGSVH